MRRLLIVATKMGYQTQVLADAARWLGVEVSLATDRCHVLEDPWGDQAIPVHFDDLEASAREVVDGRHGDGKHFDAIAAVDDRPACLAALIAARAGIPFHSVAAARAATDKFLARECFRQAGLSVPGYRRFPLEAEASEFAGDIRYPCVLKPLGLSASRGVIRANNAAEFVAAFARIRSLLRTPDLARLRNPALEHIQVEDFLPGREFALEGLMSDGRLRVLALFDKPDPLDGPYFAETIYVTPSREATAIQDAILDAAQRAVTALGLSHGPIHAEMRLDGDRVWMLEVAPRPIGGLCAKMLQFDGGIPLEELIVRHALGNDVASIRRREGAAGVMMMPVPRTGIYRGVWGVETAEAIVDEVVITAKEGQRVMPLPEGNSYLGFLFAWDKSAALAEARLRHGRAALGFDIAETLTVV